MTTPRPATSLRLLVNTYDADEIVDLADRYDESSNPEFQIDGIPIPVRRRRWSLLAAAVMVAAAACTPGGDSERAVGDRTELTSGGPKPTSDVEVSGTAPRSEVSVRGEAPKSATEVRVGEILSELDTSSTPEGTLITVPEVVLFDFDRAELKPEARATLADVAEILAFYADAPVSVRGHTDSRGDDAYNQDLSERRATAVVAALTGDHGVDAARIQAEGLGESQPVAPNERPDGSDDPEGRQRNRRVEIVLEGVQR